MRERQDQPTAIDFRDVLGATPTTNRAVRAETRGEVLVLFVPLRRRWWMAGPISWCLPLRNERGVALDQLGQEVWRACDGQRAVRDIVTDFARRHGLGFHEARLTVVKFLRMLAERRLLVLVGQPETTDQAADAPRDAGAAPSSAASSAEVTI